MTTQNRVTEIFACWHPSSHQTRPYPPTGACNYSPGRTARCAAELRSGASRATATPRRQRHRRCNCLFPGGLLALHSTSRGSSTRTAPRAWMATSTTTARRLPTRRRHAGVAPTATARRRSLAFAAPRFCSTVTEARSLSCILQVLLVFEPAIWNRHL